MQAAHEKGDLRLELLLETICATGIRVSEVKYITVEAVRSGAAEITLKGQIRTILLPNRLCRKLQKYARQQKSPRVRSSSPKAVWEWTGSRSGLK